MIKYAERRLLPLKVLKEELVAYHEAGHVIMCFLFQLNFTEVSIENMGENGEDGDLDTPDMLFSSPAFKIWGAKKAYGLIIIQYFSRIISEAFYTGIYDWHNAENDIEQVYYVMQKFNKGYDLNELWEISEKLVIKKWGFIDLLAKELLINRSLSKCEIVFLLKDKIPSGVPPALIKN